MRRILSAAVSLCIGLSAVAFPAKPAVEGPVNDYAELFTPEQVLELQHLLVDFADSTSNQICVVTVKDLEGMSASQYAIRLGLEWKVGSDDFNNGVVFLIKPKLSASDYGEAFIAVGRGLEGAIPDAICTRIVNQTAVPYFRDDDYYGGVKASCLMIMKLADEEYHSPYEDDEDELAADIAAAVIVILLIVFVVYILNTSGRNGGGSGGSGGGPRVIILPGAGRSSGGFGSGGGSFGGGFSGGFGGGSFGGGGGGGRW